MTSFRLKNWSEVRALLTRLPQRADQAGIGEEKSGAHLRHIGLVCLVIETVTEGSHLLTLPACAGIAAVVAAAERFGAAPEEPRMQTGIADVVAVAKAPAQLGAPRHVDAPDGGVRLQLRRGEARGGAEGPAPAFSARSACRRASNAALSCSERAGNRCAAVRRKSCIR